jgi:hypothetical protein
VRDVFPAAPLAPQLVAAAALEEEFGPRAREGFTGQNDHMGAPLGSVYLSISAFGRLTITARSIHGSPSEGITLFEAVEVMLPLYLAASAVTSGAYERLLGLPGWGRRRYCWALEIEERIAFPTPLAGSDCIGFPGRIPASVPLGGVRPEPSMAFSRGWDLSRLNCRPEHLVESVLGDLLAHWGYENDPVVVAEIVAALRLTRTGQLSR